ncbi:hypothetical protein KO481_23985 [Nocardia sp. NEAU-G5]|uniref:Uncharacterized protein n=1 Tax=Nocardia albiluteola TaxID=2842303 RepID=A0ABS6B2S1_9NOCA|nr:hypothetical protein [Nocardia albiluteola]MBU3064579.1 hypothetical protein [Nocardia albiluteola]
MTVVSKKPVMAAILSAARSHRTGLLTAAVNEFIKTAEILELSRAAK